MSEDEKVVIVGGVGADKSAIRAIAAQLVASGLQAVVLSHEEAKEKVVIVDDYFEPLKATDLEGLICKPDVLNRDNSWRGGSRGKGGKIKYRRT